MKRKLMLLMTCLLIGFGLVNAQVSKVTGNVTSEEDGLPVVGASVFVKGTTVGTVTFLHRTADAGAGDSAGRECGAEIGRRGAG